MGRRGGEEENERLKRRGGRRGERGEERRCDVMKERRQRDLRRKNERRK